MPFLQAGFVRTSVAFTLVGLLALLTIIGTAVWLSTETSDSTEDMISAQDARIHSARLLILAQNAETGQRGFLLTGEESYLQPYDAAMRALQPELDFMTGLARDKPTMQADLATVTALMRDKNAELARTIALKRAGQGDEALAIVRTNVGKDLMDRLRAATTKMIADADRRLADQVANVQANARWTTIVVSIGGVVSLLVVVGAIFSVMQHTRELLSTRRNVEELNRGLEDRVAERTSALTRANDEIQKFAYIVSHDLRSPLVNILGFAREVEEAIATLTTYFAAAEPSALPVFADARQAVAVDLPEALAFIRTSATKMDGLINAILRLSREGHRVLRPEALDMVALLKSSVATMQHRLSELDANVHVVDAIPRIVSDRLAIEQIFANLLDNAIKYRDPSRPLSVVLRGKAEAGMNHYEVEDNGRGIAAADYERVFELFRRSGRQDQPGEGLGLAYVRAFVRRLGGDITVRSELGKGSTFHVVLPPAPALAAAA